ncbi:MAG: bifunctional tRNA (5-methylaminomethyl-2-thiouridine)(34)-methyltransferase MnmD/FAD-dependent 5-carboxymethylaminomethyl-2-thiouridine(34) oxidoreductase MnmC [Pseudomonadales bacterium]
MTTLRPTLSAANIRWLADGSPYNVDFDDIYFAPTQGLDQSRYVFLQSNRLQQRWTSSPGHFSIGETGFGTGLNFLLTLQAWRSSAVQWPQQEQQQAQFHYYSAENFPLSRDDLQQTLSRFPELSENANLLVRQYPPLVSGFHTLQFGNNAYLHLLFGDAEHVLSQLRDSDRPGFVYRSIDAWFLDGFMPFRNPDMWSSGLLHCVAELSHQGTSFSTFSAVSNVRRELQTLGFQVNKQAGFGEKREMLLGELQGQVPQTGFRRNRSFPPATWYAAEPVAPHPANSSTQRSTYNSANRSLRSPASKRKQTVAVIGAGLAGCFTASALAKRGFKVNVYDAGDTLAAGASGVPQAALYTRLSDYASHANDFALYSYLFATQTLNGLSADVNSQLSSKPEGLLDLLTSDADQQQGKALAEHLGQDHIVRYLNAADASAVAGLPLRYPALHFPQGRAINPAQLCEHIIASQENIQFHSNQHIGSLTFLGNGNEGDVKDKQGKSWQLNGAECHALASEADIVVVCCALGSQQFSQLDWLPTSGIRGQTSSLPASATSGQLRVVLCADRYITPAIDGQHCAGSSYLLRDESTELRTAEHQANIVSSQQLLPTEFQQLDPAALQGWAGLRCTSPDYLPLVGPVPKLEQFEQAFAKLQHDKNAPLATTPPLWPGLYLNAAFGSRGLCFAPLCAELVASQITNELSPLPSPLRHALLPARFIVRNITRGVFAADKNCA